MGLGKSLDHSHRKSKSEACYRKYDVVKNLRVFLDIYSVMELSVNISRQIIIYIKSKNLHCMHGYTYLNKIRIVEAIGIIYAVKIRNIKAI